MIKEFLLKIFTKKCHNEKLCTTSSGKTYKKNISYCMSADDLKKSNEIDELVDDIIYDIEPSIREKIAQQIHKTRIKM